MPHATCCNDSKDVETIAAAAALEACFRPKSVAVVGATERPGSVGMTVVENLKKCRASQKKEENFAIYPINPGRQVCCGLPCYKDVGSCPTHVDLAVVITPAKTVPGVVETCGKAGVYTVIVISAGFKELGPEGLKLENEVLEVAGRYGVRIVGPNCLGIMAPHWGLNATFAAGDALPGNIAFMSQSGAMCTAVLDWSLKENVGFSAFVSIGSMADVAWGDLLDYLGNDPNTTSIMIYMETIGNASHFLSAARTVSAHKPIIVIKAGQTEAAAEAAASHTGSLAGSHDAFLAAMTRAGVMVVDTIGDLFNCALVLGKQPRPAGGNLLIITNAGGPGVLATDAAALNGATICKLEDTTIQTLNGILPAAWSHANPVDVLGDASAELYAKTMEVALADKTADGVLIILSPQSVTDSTGTAKAVVAACDRMKAAGTLTKPILCSWMGGNEVLEGFTMLNKHGIPAFSHPDAAARTFGMLWQHRKALEDLRTIPIVDVEPACPAVNKERAIAILKMAREQGRDLLTEAESKLVLKAYEIPIAETVVCGSQDEAVKIAHQMGYPCVVKLNSETITHKSDVGGVKLNIQSDEAVREAWTSIKENVDKIGPQHFQGVTVQPMLKLETGIELILGSIVDGQFGPLVLFGFGGCMVEIFKDSALGMPPLDPVLTQRQIESTKIYAALKGGHGQRFPGVDVKGLNRIVCRFSQMIADLSEYVGECDINPLLAMPDRLIALDARIVLNKPGQDVPKTAIRVYPQNYITQNLNVGSRSLKIYPAHAGDAERLSRFGGNGGLVGLAFSDYARSIPLVAADETSGEILAVCHLERHPTIQTTMNLTMHTADNMPDSEAIRGVLLERALLVARQENLKLVSARVPQTEVAVLNKLGFKQTDMSAGFVKCAMQL